MAKAGKITLGILICIVLPGILQCAGFFKDEWAAPPNAGCPAVQLINNVCGEDYDSVFALELISTLVFILPVAAVFSAICGCEKCGDNGDAWTCCVLVACCLYLSTIICVLIYPFVGIFIMTGCIMFSTNFPYSELGPSFSLCLTAGCIHVLGMVYLICNFFFKSDDNKTVPVRIIALQPQQVEVPTVSRRVEYTEETTTVVHDQATGTTIFSRNFKFISIFE